MPEKPAIVDQNIKAQRELVKKRLSSKLLVWTCFHSKLNRFNGCFFHQGLQEKIKSVDSLEIARKRLSSKCDDVGSDSSDTGSRKRYVSIMTD